MRAFADLPPMQRTAALVGCCLLFLMLAWSSQFGIRVATAACATLLVAIALVLPRLGVLLVVFCTPMRSVFELPQESMQVVLGAGMAAVTLRHLPLFAAFARERRPGLLLVLAAFIALFAARGALELLQHADADLMAIGREAAFYVCLMGVALAAHAHAAERGFATAMLTAAGLIVGLTVAIDTVNTYFPALGNTLHLMEGISGERFSGLHVNPNATAKYLLFGTFLAACVLVATRSLPTATLAVAGIVVTALGVGATSSKSTLLAATGALSAWLIVVLWQRAWRRAASVLAVMVLVLGAVGTWYVVVAPHAEKLALRNLLEFKKLRTAIVDRPAVPKSILQRLEDEMRIGRSYSMKVEKPPENAPANSEMYRNIPGKIVYTKRDCGWACTGQRDQLWGTGLAIVRDHWLIGIGPHRWGPEYQARLGFPFDTPHDVVLELWGGYGIAGAALYVVLLVVLLRQVYRSFTLPPSAPAFVLVTVAALYVVAMLLAELVDPAKFLAMNPHAIWLWVFAATAAGRLEQS